MTKFGLAQPVRRVEDPRLLKGDGPLHRRHHPSRHAVRRGAAQPARRGEDPRRSTPRRRQRCRACSRSITGGRPEGRRHRRPALRGQPVQEPRRLEAGQPAAPGAGRRRGAPCRRPGRLRRRRNRRSRRATAAEAIAVDYDILPSVTDLATAMDAGRAAGLAGGAEQRRASTGRSARRTKTEALFAGGRACHPPDGGEQPDRGRLDGGARRAGRVRRGDAAAGRCAPTPRAAGCSRTCSARPVFRTDPENFRVITPDVGGGFGMKLFLYPEHVLTCYAARRLGPAGEVGQRAQRGVPVPTRRAATTSRSANWRSTRTANSSRCAPATSPTWAPICPISRRSSRPWRAPACWPASTASRRSTRT